MGYIPKIQIIGRCKKCHSYSYNLKLYNNKELCVDCLNGIDIDTEWLIDYQNALGTLNGELILCRT